MTLAATPILKVYFVWNGDLLYVKDVVDGYVMIENCKTYEIAFIAVEDFDTMQIEKVGTW